MPSANINPNVFCPCYIICRVNTSQWYGWAAMRCRPSTTTTLVNGIEIDNSWIVSYNIYLLLKYASYINVIVCKYM
jgi:hypothetical protein